MATKSTKFDIKSEAVRPFYASVGVTDLAVEAVREYAADVQAKVRGYQANVQKNVSELDLQPKALREQAVTLVDENVAALGETYTDLVKRGESLVGRIRRQQSTQDAVKSAETTKAKAKTTRTQATKSAKATKKAATSAAKRTTTTAKKRSTAPASSAKATTTAAKKTATAATKAVADAAQKVGD
ncbi:MAG: hypothetical protein ABIQ15_16005 [Nocardioides sp.]